LPLKRHTTKTSSPGGIDSKCLSYLEVDDELEPDWLHHQQIGRLFVAKDAVDVIAALAVGVRYTRAIACEPTRLEFAGACYAM
jgi:hypothetical protein